MFLNTLFCIFTFSAIDSTFQEKSPTLRDDNYITSTVHALFTFTLSLMYLLNKVTSKIYTNLTCVSIAYAVQDIHHVVKINSPGRNFLVIHHVMIIIVNMWVNFYEDSFVLEMMAYNYLTEFTTPFLNLSLYLYKNKKTELKVYNFDLFRTCNIILIVSFLFFRIFLGIYLVKVNLFYNILSYFQVLMLGMNIYWFKKLIKKAIKFI